MKKPQLKVSLAICIVLAVCGYVWFRSNTDKRTTGANSVKHSSPGASKDDPGQIDLQNSIAAAPSTDRKSKMITAGGLSMPIRFEDRDGDKLSAESEAAIIADIQLVYEHLDNHEFQTMSPRVVQLNGAPVTVTDQVHFYGGARRRPKAHSNLFGWLVKAGTGFEIVVPKALVRAYLDAFEFKSSHKAAFERLEAFFSLLASNNADRWSGLDISSLVWMPAGQAVTPQLEVHLREQLMFIQIRRPSVLDFSPMEASMFSDVGGKPSGIVGRTLLLDKSGKPTNYIGLYFLSGKWQLAFL